jgi:putative transposase
MTSPKPFPYHMLRDPEKASAHRRAAVLEVRTGTPKSTVAKRYGISRETLYTWLERADPQTGDVPLRAPGPECQLSPGQLARLAQLLRRWPRELGIEADRWTLRLMRDLIEREFAVSYHPHHVARILEAIGFSHQRPERQARQQDPEKIREWEQTVLPRVEKKGG